MIVLQKEGQVLIATPGSYAALTRGLLRGTWGESKEAARLREVYRLRRPDALLPGTALGAAAGAFLTNDAALKLVKAEGIALLLLDDYLKSTASG